MHADVMRRLLARFEARRALWLELGYEGRYVAVAEYGEAGFYKTDEDARHMGLCAFGGEPMLVLRIECGRLSVSNGEAVTGFAATSGVD